MTVERCSEVDRGVPTRFLLPLTQLRRLPPECGTAVHLRDRGQLP